MSNSRKVKKIDMARNLYQNNAIQLSRTNLIQLFTDKLNVSDNTARTYLNKCALELNTRLNLPPVKTREIDRSSCKKYQAQKIFNDNPQLSRPQIIRKIHSECDTTLKSAETYCSIFAKQYNRSIPHKAIRLKNKSK